MAHAPDQDTTPPQEEKTLDAQRENARETAIDTPAQDASPEASSAVAAIVPPATSDSSDTASAEPAPEAAAPPGIAPEPEAPSAQSGNLAEISTRLRQEAAEITEIAAQAGRLGIAIDAAKALREGTTPEALRSLVLERASAAADARDVVAAPPSPALPQKTESPLVAAAKRDAAASKSG